GQGSGQAGAGAVALFEVYGVDYGLAGDVLESALDDWGFRRVDHERQGRLGGKTAGDLGHIGHSVLTGVVDTNVEDVAARPHRLLGQRRAGVPVLFEHGVPETL